MKFHEITFADLPRCSQVIHASLVIRSSLLQTAKTPFQIGITQIICQLLTCADPKSVDSCTETCTIFVNKYSCLVEICLRRYCI